MALTLLYAVLLAFVPYLVAVGRAPKLDWRRTRWWIVALALAARAGMLALPVPFGDDLYRYWWEGRVQLAGENPYRHAPEAAELTGLRDANWEHVGHKEVPSAYPPVLLGVFRVGARLGRSPDVFRWIFTAFDLAIGWLLVRLLRASGQNESLSLIWLLNPLVILEFAGNGHEMSLPICMFVAGLWLLAGTSCTETCTAKHHVAAGIAFASAVLAHVMAWPVILSVIAAERMRSWRFWLAFAGILALCSWPAMDAGNDALLGLMNVAGRWRFNGSLFEVLVRFLGHEDPRRGFGGVWVVYELPKRIAAAAFLAVLGWTTVRRYGSARAALTVTGALLLLSPTVHPWYVTWVVALVCVEFSVAWLAFSGFVIVSYVARVVELETGVWVDAGFVRWMEYAPLLLLLAAEWWWKPIDTRRARQ